MLGQTDIANIRTSCKKCETPPSTICFIPRVHGKLISQWTSPVTGRQMVISEANDGDLMKYDQFASVSSREDRSNELRMF
jgi:hypothetical protein